MLRVTRGAAATPVPWGDPRAHPPLAGPHRQTAHTVPWGQRVYGTARDPHRYLPPLPTAALQLLSAASAGKTQISRGLTRLGGRPPNPAGCRGERDALPYNKNQPA